MITTLTFAASSFAGNLKIKVFNPGANAIFPIASTIIYGDKDAILIDAQFQKQYALKLVDEIKATGKNLTTVYISHSDPDFYFALDVIKKAFPNAKIISTAQTAYLISASKDEKQKVWNPQLKNDAPSEIIIPEAVTSIPNLEGHQLEIISTPNDPAHSFVWIPSLKTIVGGISVSEGSHLWMADTRGINEIDNWVAQIDKMKKLNPEKVIPSHFVQSDYSPKVLDFVKEYLTAYKQAATGATNAQSIIDYMLKKYPNLPAKESLEMGAKVFTGEMQWEVKSPYPPIGKKVVVNFGVYVFELNFKDNKHMTFTSLAGETKGYTEDVEYTAVEVSPNVFMVYWKELKTNTNVIHLQNYNTHQVWTNIASKDASFIHLNGTIKVEE